MSVAPSPRPTSPGGRHRSRPSFTIGYSQPSPLRMPTSSTSSQGVPVGPDPRPPTSASSIPTRRPSSSSSTVNPTTNTSPVVNPPSKRFVAPAHPQSHHLHTIPPREKTTRTLILDHTAWRQGRTRFAQGRCELGMSVRFKSEERTTEGTETTGGRAGFYIGSAGSSGPRRVSNFGDPPEVELASSDDEGEDGDAKESDGEGVRALMYGKHFKQICRKRKQDARAYDRMEVDTENEPNSGSDSDEESPAGHFSTGPQDPSLAPLLAARATGIEKVLHAMLAQPPSSPPRSPSPHPYALHSSHANSQHFRLPPPSVPPSPQPSEGPSRVLPNGLRLRLALLALVNDLFERQPPPCEQQSSFAADDGSSVKPVASTSANPSDASKQTPGPTLVTSPPLLPPPSLPPSNGIPFELAALAQISSQPFHAAPTLPSFHTLALPSASIAMSTTSPISGTGYRSSTLQKASSSPSQPTNRAAVANNKGPTESGQSSSQQAPRPPPPLFSWTRTSAAPGTPSSPLASSPRSTTPLGSSSLDKDSERVSTNSSTSLPRYPSSWKRGSQNVQPDKCAPIIVSNPGLVKRARGRSRELYMTGCYTKPSITTSISGSSFRTNAPMYSYSPARPPTSAPGYPLKKLKLLCPRHLREKCRICTSSKATRGGPSTRIGAGLLKKQGGFLSDATRQTGSVLADLIPRFLRLSALVAMELGREARGEEPEANDGQENVDKPDSSDAHSPDSSCGTATRIPLHAQPTRAWFALLCGLLTRAVLEGYVAREWKGSEYAEILLGVGLGIKGVGTRKTPAVSATVAVSALEIPTVEDHVDELEPDEMPGLIDAAKALFSGLVQDSFAPGREKATRSAEEEYVVEMDERLSEFLAVPLTTPDLATHLSQLSEKYPAESVERAALRFCEAVAKWRGKPELEVYKRQPTRTSAKSESLTPLPLSIDALLASSPTPVAHRPPIDKFFRVPPRSSIRVIQTPLRVLKRQRSVDDLEREAKKEKLEVTDVDLDKALGVEDEAMQDDIEWVGPYGV